MHMLLMLGIMAAVFFATMILMCCFREKLKTRLIHYLFVFGTAVFFFAWNYAAYERGWLKDGFMTLENISPYVCTIILVSPFLSEKIREFAHCAIAFLSLGMLLALFISPGAEYISSTQYTASFMNVSEAACHLVMGLFGFYLVLSDQVAITRKNLAKAAAFIYASILFGVFLNWCFHLNNFGMDMYGGYSIYFIDIFGSFTATFIAYLVGVFGTIVLGYLASIFVDWISRPADKTAPDSEVTDEDEAELEAGSTEAEAPEFSEPSECEAEK